jgi:hypothetical protein
VEGVETDINASKTEEQLAEVNGKMKAIEARLVALTNFLREAYAARAADGGSLATVDARL